MFLLVFITKLTTLTGAWFSG